MMAYVGHMSISPRQLAARMANSTTIAPPKAIYGCVPSRMHIHIVYLVYTEMSHPESPSHAKPCTPA